MRLFVAVDVPKEVEEEVKRLQDEIPENTGNFTKPDPGQSHITLTFLGDVNQSKVEEIKEKLDQVNFKPCTIKTNGLGFFPNENYIRVFWLGFEDNPRLEKLAENVRKALPSFEDDHDFHAHVTLARVKSLPGKVAFKKDVEEMDVRDIEFQVDSFKLVKSELGREGPEYEVVEEYYA